MRRVEAVRRLSPGDPGWPAGLQRLGAEAPVGLEVVGAEQLMLKPALGLFCSQRAPGRIIVESYDVARALASSGEVVVGGFHSPMERELLSYLLQGSASVIICPARRSTPTAVPRSWRRALGAGRLLIVSPFPPGTIRPTSATAELRNRFAAALSARLLILHATVGGRLARLARECASWKIPVHCLDHPANEDLRLLGATPLAGFTRHPEWAAAVDRASESRPTQPILQ
ncbi:MAG TPA: hypothetical protein VF167_17495 [Longimicrobiaceae bacterium]